ncbi:MAG: lysophospholipid acyltransferase family protein, partial [Thermodesulfobacteriota bacterium]
TPHLGNWELGGYVLAQKGYPIHILTLKEESPFLSRYEKKLRQKVGIHTMIMDPREKPNLAILEMVQGLRRNELLAMLADRTYDAQGVEVEFFSRPTLFPAGAIHLALETGAEVIPVFVILNEKKKYWGIIDEPIPLKRDIVKDEAVKQGVQEMAKRFEEIIRKYPDQWLNFFPFWKEKR